jgi:hypothetical protein
MRLSGSDLAVSAAVLLGAAGLMGLFVTDLNSVSLRKGERELGTVVFKRLTATRKAPSGLGWEVMRNNSPIYDADTLRTADFSEASVFFDDGTSLDMLENSMLKLNFGGGKKDLEFLSGEISVGSAENSTSYTISSTAGKINVVKGSKATFSREADSLSVEVSQGTASIVKEDGSSQTIAKNQELQVDVKSGMATLVSRPIAPVSPERNGRLLSFAGGTKAAVDFAWLLEGTASKSAKAVTGEKAEFTLEISRSKDFETSESERVKGLTARQELEAGTWYWRVRDSSGERSPARKFSLDIAEAPRPAFPPDGQEYAYRSLKPSISFAWTAMKEASSYLFELSSEPSFAKPELRTRTTTSSLAVDSLGEGSWYWRVAPVHAFTVVGQVPAASARRFAIAKRAAMAAPAVTAPFEGSLYQIQDVDGKGLSFSWIPEAEAVSYELLVSKERDLSSPLATVPAAQSYVSLSGAEAAALKRAAVYYWGLRWIDKEGNASPTSPGRALRGIDGSIAIRLSFPPEGYRVADSLIANTRFGWKSNVPARTVFQVSRDEAFQDVAYQETVTADTLIGRSWKSGAYYWRLRTFNADNSVFLETQGRSFRVVDPFAGPVLLTPSPGSSFYLRERDSEVFSWTPIGEADYYNFSLRSAADGYAKPVFEASFAEKPSLSYPLGGLPSGTYRLSVQAFAASSEKTTRIIGYIGDSDFTYKRISPIKLASPADGEHVSGLAARKGAALFAYGIEAAPDSAEILVSTDPAGSKVVARSSDRSGRGGVGRLNPGVYYWTVKGLLSGLDVSSKERYRFEVDPPPPPPAPELASPLEGSLYKVQDVDKGLSFSWEAKADAASYELVVSKSKDLSSPFARIATTRSSINLSGQEAESLKRPGDYYWGVRWTNTEGDVSLRSPGRELAGVDASKALGPSFPPEGYRIADSLMTATRFAWQSSLDARSVFQVASDPAFERLVYQEAVSEKGIAGRELKVGNYYWRIRTYNADGSAFLDTEPRGFVVVPPFASVALERPAPGSSFYLREGESLVFSWKPIEGADYYGLTLRSSADAYASVVFAKEELAGASLAYPLGDLPGGSYRLSIQAFARASDQATRIDGRVGDSGFAYKRLGYVRLLEPSDKAVLPGLATRRLGATFAYDARDAQGEAQVLILGDPSGQRVLRSVPTKTGSALIKGLLPGTYFWTVKGSFASFDLSARERYRFEIETPPPLPATELLTPQPRTVVGAAQLRESRKILLSWQPVAGATHYRLAVYLPGKKEPVLAKEKLSATSYAIEDLSVLDRGQISWSIQAQSYDQAGELEQGGLEAKSSFTLDIPAVKKAKSSSEGKTYGR